MGDSPHETSKWTDSMQLGRTQLPSSQRGLQSPLALPYNSAHKLSLLNVHSAICPFPVLNKHFCHSQGYRRCGKNTPPCYEFVLQWPANPTSARALPAAHPSLSAPLLPIHTAALCVSTVLGPISAPPQVSTGYPFLSLNKEDREHLT